MSDIRRRVIRTIASLVVTAALVTALVLWVPSRLYLWLKALHVVAVIIWIAGMFYLPQLFADHCEAEAGTRQAQAFKRMEQRVLTVIVNPAMVVSWAVGLWLVGDGGWMLAGWLQAKVALVLLLSGVHGYLVRWANDFGRDDNRHSPRFYRTVNELLTIMMMGIVVLAVVKPF